MTYEEFMAETNKNVEEAKKYIDVKLYEFDIVAGDAVFMLPEEDYGKVKANKSGFIIAFMHVSEGVVIAKHLVKKVREG